MVFILPYSLNVSKIFPWFRVLFHDYTFAVAHKCLGGQVNSHRFCHSSQKHIMACNGIVIRLHPLWHFTSAVASPFHSEKLALSRREFVEFCRELWLNYSLVESSLCLVVSFVFAVTLMVLRIHFKVSHCRIRLFVKLRWYCIFRCYGYYYHNVIFSLTAIVSSASISIVAHAFLAPVINDKSIQTKPEWCLEKLQNRRKIRSICMELLHDEVGLCR